MKTRNFLIVLALMACFMAYGKEKKKEWIGIEEQSNMKEYNPNAQWRHVDCKHCKGTGFTVVAVLNRKTLKSVKVVRPCSWCKGTGKRGMSKY